MPSYLKKYVRNSKNNPIGVVIACLDKDDKITLGHAKCHKTDTYDSKRMMQIAIGRALSQKPSCPAVTVLKTIENMAERAVKYYKGKTISRQAATTLYLGRAKARELKASTQRENQCRSSCC